MLLRFGEGQLLQSSRQEELGLQSGPTANLPHGFGDDIPVLWVSARPATKLRESGSAEQ